MRVVFEHCHAHLPLLLLARHDAQRFEAAHMSANHEDAATVAQVAEQKLAAMDFDIKQLALAAQQIESIKNGGGKCQVMRKGVACADRVVEDAVQILARIAACVRGTQPEPGGNRVEQPAGPVPADLE